MPSFILQMKMKSKREDAVADPKAFRRDALIAELQSALFVGRKGPRRDSLQAERIVEHGGIERSIYRISGILSEQECKRCIHAAEASDCFEHQSSPNSPEYAFRDHYRIRLHSPEIANLLWKKTGLKDVFSRIQSSACSGHPVGLNPVLRIYKYNAGKDCFGKHIDESDMVEGGRTEYTLLIYLSTTKGGETAFYDERGRLLAGVEPRAGMALLHRHGDDHCLEHEALKVREGCKYVLRSDIVYSG